MNSFLSRKRDRKFRNQWRRKEFWAQFAYTQLELHKESKFFLFVSIRLRNCSTCWNAPRFSLGGGFVGCVSADEEVWREGRELDCENWYSWASQLGKSNARNCWSSARGVTFLLILAENVSIKFFATCSSPPEKNNKRNVRWRSRVITQQFANCLRRNWAFFVCR